MTQKSGIGGAADAALIARLDAALARRAAWEKQWVARETTVWRLVHSAADGVPGITVDRFGDRILVESHREGAPVDAVVAWCARRLGLPVFYKPRHARDPRDRAGYQVWGPAADPDLWVREEGMWVRIRLTASEHVGWFGDARVARQLVRRLAGGRRVLNLFSYTCGFGMAAAAGGARSTVNIDNKATALQAGRINYARNGLPADPRTFFACDVLYFLRRAARQRGRYDLVVIDPPPRFARKKARDFVARKDLGSLIAACAAVTARPGWMVVGLNAPGADRQVVVDAVHRAAQDTGVVLEPVLFAGPGRDYPPGGDRPVARFCLVAARDQLSQQM